MSEVIKFQSSEKYTQTSPVTFSADSKDCITCTSKIFTETLLDISSGLNTSYISIAWKFEWNELKKPTVIGFKGHLIAHYKNGSGSYFPIRFEIWLKRSGQWIERRLGKSNIFPQQANGYRYFKYEFELTPIYEEIDKGKLAENFKSLSLTDAVLVVEEQKIHVNKAFLSYQSDYFNSLFNSNFKEKNINEIPIEDVKYEDFALLLSVIHSNPIPPTDETAPKLLELAERFLMPAVTCHVESYLLSSTLELMEKLCLADKYKLKRLVDNCALQLKTQRQLENITRSEHFEYFSQDTQYKILQRFLSIA